jgi:hypothetical protein
MWTYEHAVPTDAASEAIWALWADVAHWGAWNADIKHIAIDGPFTTGAQIVMTPAGQDPVRLRIVEATVNEGFVDKARIDGLSLRTTHRVKDNHVVYRMEITGPDADEIGPRIGPAITADWPDTMDALVRLAEQR